MRKASAGLILDNNRVLAFRRYGEVGLSLPCGIIEGKETPIQAAFREVKEETGFEVDFDKEMKPFVGFDITGNTLVYTFIGKIKSGTILNECLNEGIPMWSGIREIVYGPFGHYNNRALQHFNVQIPITGKFHSHLTIDKPELEEDALRAAKLVNGKLTVIDLSRENKTQTDIMITHHYLTDYRGLEDEHHVLVLLKARAKLLQESGFNIKRIKLEHEPLHKKSPLEDVIESLNRIYTEIHIKCLIAEENVNQLIDIAKGRNWHPSKNPFAIKDNGLLVRFVNKRFYGGRLLYQLDNEVDKLIPEISSICAIEEIKYETAIYDSNDELDKWWMK